MALSRRNLLAVAGATLPTLALAPTAVAAPRTADLSTPEGWLEWIGAHPDRIALVVDGPHEPLTHRARAAQPLASAVKVVHLAAYATAVAEGRTDPQEHVRVGDWERYYVPLDGGAHVRALNSLGIPLDATGFYAADPERLVTVDQVAAAMITFSDGAAPDYLRDRLGDALLHRAAWRGGWPRPDIRSLCAEYLFILFPEYAPPPEAPPAVRKIAGDQLEHRYGTDADLRTRTLDRILRGLPPYDVLCDRASPWPQGTAQQLGNIHRALATDTFVPRRAAEIARNHLAGRFRENLPPGIAAMGIKGGNLPGMLTAGMWLRRTDGSVSAASLLAHGEITAQQYTTGDPVLPLLHSLLDPAWRDRLVRALRV